MFIASNMSQQYVLGYDANGNALSGPMAPPQVPLVVRQSVAAQRGVDAAVRQMRAANQAVEAAAAAAAMLPMPPMSPLVLPPPSPLLDPVNWQSPQQPPNAQSSFPQPYPQPRAHSLSPYAQPFVPSTQQYTSYTPSIQGPQENPYTRSSYLGVPPQGGGSHGGVRPNTVSVYNYGQGAPVLFQPSQPAVTPQQQQQGRTYDNPISVQSPSLDAGWQTNNRSDELYLGHERITRKAARSTMDRIYNSLKNAQGGGYMGVTATSDQKLTIHNDAVVFVDELSKIMDVTDGRV